MARKAAAGKAHGRQAERLREIPKSGWRDILVLNSEMEHQTARDTSRGRSQPMGQRGARAADTVADKPE